MTKIFPVTIIVLSGCASIVYAIKGDYYHARYWFFAALLSASVTF
ncbi:MAG TPA: hypothetical protein PLX02_12155 [Syntrophorhabdaceae bacterium]|nr:hypothetical protein [Syntrophorhabdaceae bacterium]HQM82365.1 hypothetical protein [Syntrophorhabdaceae bacterium]